MIPIEDITNMLDELGVDATLKTNPTAVLDPDTNRTSAGSVINTAVKAVPPYRTKDQWGNTDLIASGEGLTGIANSGLGSVVVKPGMQIVIAGTTWTVTGVTPISDDEGVKYYQLEIKS
jgi:hypothetical protein